jgi:hypothetical protein
VERDLGIVKDRCEAVKVGAGNGQGRAGTVEVEGRNLDIGTAKNAPAEEKIAAGAHERVAPGLETGATAGGTVGVEALRRGRIGYSTSFTSPE